MVRNKHVSEHLHVAIVARRDFGSRHRPALHYAGAHERRLLRPCTKALRILVRIRKKRETVHATDHFRGERVSHHTIGQALFEVPILIRSLGKNVYTAPLLREAVIRTVDNSPFDRVAERCKAGQNDCEIAATLANGALQQTVDILKQNETWPILKLKEPVDIPPENTLLTLDSTRLGKRLCHRIVLAREASDNHIDIGNVNLARLIFIKHEMNVFIHHRPITKSRLITPGSKLLYRRSRWLPLVSPNRHKRTCRRHGEFRMLLVLIALEAKAKTAHAGKQLCYANNMSRHVSPFDSFLERLRRRGKKFPLYSIDLLADIARIDPKTLFRFEGSIGRWQNVLFISSMRTNMTTTVLGRLYRSIRMAAAHTTLHLLVTTARLQKIAIWHLPEKHLRQAVHASLAFSFSEYNEEVFLVQLFVEIALGKGSVCQDTVVERGK